MECTCYRLSSLGSRCWGWVGSAKSLLQSNIYERKRWRSRIGQGEPSDHDTEPTKFLQAWCGSWEQRWSIREVPHSDLCRSLAQSLAMAHHETSILLAITLLLRWLKGYPRKNVASPQKPQRTESTKSHGLSLQQVSEFFLEADRNGTSSRAP